MYAMSGSIIYSPFYRNQQKHDRKITQRSIFRGKNAGERKREGQNACIKSEAMNAYSQGEYVFIKFSLNPKVPSSDLECTRAAISDLFVCPLSLSPSSSLSLPVSKGSGVRGHAGVKGQVIK